MLLDVPSQDERDLDSRQCGRCCRRFRFTYRWCPLRNRRDESQLHEQDDVEEFRVRSRRHIYPLRERLAKMVGVWL